MLNLCSDNEGPIAPKILESIVDANSGFAHSYGEDKLTGQLKEVFSEVFEREAVSYTHLTLPTKA